MDKQEERSIMGRQEALKEKWKKLKLEGCGVRYKISNYGRVYDKQTGKYVSQVITGKPQYWYVNLRMDTGKRILRRVHRLLAQTHIPNPEGLCTVDHIDRNKYNNSIDNLRWVDRTQNSYNRDEAIIFKGVPLKAYCQENFDQPEGAYSYLQNHVSNLGKTEDEALLSYTRYRKYGQVGNTNTVVRGREVSVAGFLTKLGITGDEYLTMKECGLSSEDMIQGYKYPVPQVSKLLVGTALYSEKSGTMQYYPSQVVLQASMGLRKDSIKLRRDTGCITVEDYLNYTHHPTHTFNGFTGTLRELSDHVGLRYETVADRVNNKGWSLEKALATKRLRVTHYYVDGVRMTKKNMWYKYLPLEDPKTLNTRQGQLKGDVLAVLKYYGVDTTNLDIQPCI